MRVTSEIEEICNGQMGAVIEKLDELKKLSPDAAMGKLTLAFLPPCLKNLMAMAQRGENISHSGRFTLATFLHHVGAPNEDILELFANSPDFDEGMARYQIEHLTGVTSGKEYTPPECGTMKSNGNCFEPDNLCSKDWMSHPLKYYRTKARGRAKKRMAEKDAKEAEKKAKESAQKTG